MMLHIRYGLLLVGLFFALGDLSAQRKSKPDFPETWKGNWDGQVLVTRINTGEMLYNIRMRLRIETVVPDSVYSFTIQYDTSAPRLYTLLLEDRKTARWKTDENNSIVLKGYYHAGHYVDFYSVNSNLIRTDFSLHPDGKSIQVRMETWHDYEKEPTGAEIQNMTVHTYPPGILQYGVLQKQKVKKKR